MQTGTVPWDSASPQHIITLTSSPFQNMTTSIRATDTARKTGAVPGSCNTGTSYHPTPQSPDPQSPEAPSPTASSYRLQFLH